MRSRNSTKRIAFCLVCHALGCVAVASGQERKIDRLTEAIKRQWMDHRNITFRFKEETNKVQPDRHLLQAEGFREIARTENGSLLRSESTHYETREVEGKEVKTGPIRALFICDGKHRYKYEEGEPTALRWPETDCHDPVRRLEWLKENYDLKFKRDEQLDGNTVWVLEVSRKGVPVREWVLYYLADGSLMKQVQYNLDNTLKSTIEYSDYKFDVSLDSKRFEFIPPPGVRLEDRKRESP
jgi:hypothetical protein